MKPLSNRYIESCLHKVMTARPKNSHKGDYGHVLIVGGSEQYGGAAILSALACVNSGAGLTTVASDPMNRTALLSRCPEAMFIDSFDSQLLLKIMSTVDVILIGPGLGLNDSSKQIFNLVMNALQSKQICIIDGSALTLLAEDFDILKGKSNIILTPHQKEWERISTIEISQQTPENTQEFTKDYQTMIVLKMHQTELYYREDAYKIPYGNPGMATGGMGDVLAGMIAAFFAQYSNSIDTLIAAVSLHSMIADDIAMHHHVVLPTRLIENISKTMSLY